MGLPIKNPSCIVIETDTKDRIAGYKARKKMNVRNMDTVINNLIDFYEKGESK